MRQILRHLGTLAVLSSILCGTLACNSDGSNSGTPVTANAANAAPAVPSAPSFPSVGTGWTDLTPSADSRIVYVSSSAGDDANDGLTEQTPVRTIARGKSLLRDAHPDHLLLKAGDQWDEMLGRWEISGRSNAEPMVVSSYGAGPRPLLRSFGAEGLRKVSGDIAHVFIVGLELYNASADPSSPSFNPAISVPKAISWIYSGNDILLENCRIRFFQGISFVRSTAALLSDIRIRRCVVLDNYSYSTDSHSQGVFASKVDGLLVEENVFDHNGWNEQLAGAEATMFNHNIYVSSCNGTVLRGNLFLRASSIGSKFRSDETLGSRDILIENNLYVEGEVGISFGGKNDPASRFENVTVRNNVFLNQGRTNPTGRNFGWGITANNVNIGLFAGNYFLHQDVWDNSVGIRVDGNFTSNVTVKDNLAFRMKRRALYLLDTAGWSNVSVEGNILQDPDQNGSLVRHEGGFAGITYSANTYHAVAAHKLAVTDAGDRSYGEWIAESGETGSTEEQLNFVDPYRTVETYQASIGGGNSFAEFIAGARAQAKGQWSAEYTAAAVNDYVRAGFAIQ